ncbi:PDZ domain-containing protein, partial [Paucihalobacter sp.]|uniref:PDZ domain-containing protein n=1 Tax=Paucihalobacter sp. TaxID=2850405 RepID=UPI003D160444
SLKSFLFKNVNAAFPDSSSINAARLYKERNGSIAGGILRRFNIIMDYPSRKLTLKKNGNYNLPFGYNKSGIVLEQRGFRVVKEVMNPDVKDIYGRSNESSKVITTSIIYGYNLKPAFEVVVVRPNSVAAEAGINVGDVVLSINRKPTQNLSLQEVNKMFYLKAGSVINMRVKRDEKELNFEFKLVDEFK